MIRRGSLWMWLVLLVLVAVTPFLTLRAYTISQSWNERRQRAEADVLSGVEVQADRLDDELRSIGQILATLGVLVSTDPADIAANDALLQVAKATLPAYYSGLAAVDAQGRNIGFGVPQEAAGRGASVADRAYFQASLRTRETVVGDPVISRSTGVSVIPIARAAVGPDGEVRAVTLAAIEQRRLQELLDPAVLSPSALITVISPEGVVLARSLNPEEWVGKDISGSSNVQEVLLRREGADIHTSADGVERVVAFTPLTEAPWLIYVGIPEQVVFGPVRAALLRDSLLALFSLLLTLAAATVMARRIARPLTRLAEDAAAFGAGDLQRRTSVRAGAEIGVLARGFNQMADALARDITDRARTAEALRRSEALLSAVLDALPVGVVIADADGKLIRTNAAHDALWGVAPETTSWEQYGAWVGYWPATGERIQAHEWAMARALRAGEVVTGELVAYEPFGSGQRRFYVNNAAPVRDTSGAIVAGVVAELDVTESRRLYEAEQQARAEAQQALAQVSSLQRVTAALVESLTPEAVATTLVRALADLFGTREVNLACVVDDGAALELMGVAGYAEQRVPPGARIPLAFRSPLTDAVRSGEPVFLESPAAFDERYPGLRAAYGAADEGAWAAVPLYVDGRPIGGLRLAFPAPRAFPVDERTYLVTLAQQGANAVERARLQAELAGHAAELEARVAARTAELEQANVDLEQFASIAAHDLRAPLRGIQGFAAIVEEDYTEALDTQGQQYVSRIREAAAQMDQLIQDLLQYSRMSRAMLELQPVPLEAALAEAQGRLAADLERSAARLMVSTPLPIVRAHRSTLTQVLANLLANAITFVAPDVRPEVRVWAETDDRVARLWIADNGIGIAPAHQARIFQAFERLHGQETYPGTGIGLAIVRRGLERMGGQAGVESTPGQGSRFWIELALSDRETV